jgi:Fe-S-cluster containining protein
MRWRGGRKPARPDTGAGPPGIPDRVLEAADRDLLAVVEAAARDASRRAGAQLACRLGCTECCIGPFPINRLDARRLRRGLEALAARDPGAAGTIRRRAAEAIGAFRADFPGDPTTGRLSGDEDAEDRFFETHAGVPCPVLDPATGACLLYEHRPISCRTYGPPVRFGGRDLPPCRLCFVGAPPAAIERCRVEPDPDRIEDAILDRLRKTDGDDRETIIAFAVAPDPGPRR